MSLCPPSSLFEYPSVLSRGYYPVQDEDPIQKIDVSWDEFSTEKLEKSLLMKVERLVNHWKSDQALVEKLSLIGISLENKTNLDIYNEVFDVLVFNIPKYCFHTALDLCSFETAFSDCKLLVTWIDRLIAINMWNCFMDDKKDPAITRFRSLSPATIQSWFDSLFSFQIDDEETLIDPCCKKSIPPEWRSLQWSKVLSSMMSYLHDGAHDLPTNFHLGGSIFLSGDTFIFPYYLVAAIQPESVYVSCPNLSIMPLSLRDLRTRSLFLLDEAIIEKSSLPEQLDVYITKKDGNLYRYVKKTLSSDHFLLDEKMRRLDLELSQLMLNDEKDKALLQDESICSEMIGTVAALNERGKKVFSKHFPIEASYVSDIRLASEAMQRDKNLNKLFSLVVFCKKTSSSVEWFVELFRVMCDLQSHIDETKWNTLPWELSLEKLIKKGKESPKDITSWIEKVSDVVVDDVHKEFHRFTPAAVDDLRMAFSLFYAYVDTFSEMNMQEGITPEQKTSFTKLVRERSFTSHFLENDCKLLFLDKSPLECFDAIVKSFTQAVISLTLQKDLIPLLKKCNFNMTAEDFLFSFPTHAFHIMKFAGSISKKGVPPYVAQKIVRKYFLVSPDLIST
jgi:hypothetical protein